MDFVAIGVISDLDERYFDTLRDPLKDRMYVEDFKLPILNIKKREVKTDKLSKTI